MIVMGVDQGIANFGYAVLNINDEGLTVLTTGTVKTLSKHSTGKRLIALRTKVEELMSEYNPTLMGCEKLFYNAPTGGRNKSLGMMHVNMATAMLHMVTTENNMSLGEYPPTTVKKSITGNGRATKEEMSAAIEPFLTKAVKTEHEIDAIAIGITTYRKCREEEMIIVKNNGKTKKKSEGKKGKGTKGEEGKNKKRSKAS